MFSTKFVKNPADFQIRKLKNSCIQRHRTQKFPHLPANSEDSRPLKESETEFAA